jgi:hypothetical protein
MSTAQEALSDPFERGRDRLRETIKWLIASFGAIGASLAVGSQLSHAGRLSGLRLLGAFAGGVIGFVGVFLAMYFAVKVLTGSHITLGELGRDSQRAGGDATKMSRLVRFFEDENKYILVPYASLSELRDKFDEASRGTDDTAYAKVASQVRAVVNAASFEQLRLNFDNGLNGIMRSVAAAAAGILLFAWAANPASPSSSSTTTSSSALAPLSGLPVQALLSLSPSGRATLARDLGKKCGPSDIAVVVVSATEGEVEVVTLPMAKCAVRRFVVTPDLGRLQPAKPVCRFIKAGGGLRVPTCRPRR